MSLRSTAERTFSSLANPNYRKYFFGQSTSLVGTWMQSTAQSWLVLVLTHSATAIGVVVALQTLPVLILGPYGGVIADRVDKRRLMIVLQSLMAVQAAVLATFTLLHDVTYLDVCVLAVVLGLNNSFENPSRQAFMLEMVGPDDLRNAVSLNSTMNNAARAVGPAVAGILIAAVGEGWCFVLNAVSFIAVVGSLMVMDQSTLSPSPPAARERGQLRAGFRYVFHTPALLIPLIMMGLVGTFAYEFQVTLPVVASQVFHGGSRAYGFLVTAMGVGAVIGGLVSATRGRVGIAPMVAASTIFAGVLAIASVAPIMAFEMVALALVGFASVSFLSMANSTLQLASDPAMRGRVMALWAVAFLGSTPVGGPLVGLVTSHWGARVGLGVGALSCAVAAAIGFGVVRRSKWRVALVDRAAD
ncbi:MAG: MFS transporter [Actinomycetales bacterium]|nr:MFS transporter [Actinomycetales bacterium]